MVFESIVAGAIAGASYGLLGYFKNKKANEVIPLFTDPGFKFDWISILSSIAGAGLIGGLAAYLGQTPDFVRDGAFGLLLTQFIKKMVKSW